MTSSAHNLTPLPIEKLSILGLGLIGGSLAMAVKKYGLAKHVTAWGRSVDKLKKGVSRGAIDSYSTDLAEAIADADVIIIATPVLHAQQQLIDLFAVHHTTAIVSDVGSTKENMYVSLKRELGFVPQNVVLAHPIAGAETSGIDFARDDLYCDHRVILTPDDNTSRQALALIEKLWQSVGAEVVCMSARQHDAVLAATSHLPHFLAYAMVDTVMSMESKQDVFQFAAGGFRDFTRIAQSSPTMWHDIALTNKQALLDSIDQFNLHLSKLRVAIENEDSDKLLSILREVSQVRKQLRFSPLSNDSNV